jgi:hypothetical protein
VPSRRLAPFAPLLAASAVLLACDAGGLSLGRFSAPRPDSADAARAAVGLVGTGVGERWRDSVTVVSFRRDSLGALVMVGFRNPLEGVGDGCVVVRVDEDGRPRTEGWCR